MSRQAARAGRFSELGLATLLVLASVGCEKANSSRSEAPEATSLPEPAPDGAAPRQAATFLPSENDAGLPESTGHASHPASPKPHMRVSSLEGKARTVGTTLRAGVELRDATTLELPQGAVITLSLDDYVRVRIVGPALAQLLPKSEAAVLLREGLATVDVAPRGKRMLTSAFWLATPTLRLDVPDSARLAIRAFANATTQLAVVSGFLTISQPRQPLGLTGGSSVCVTLVEAKALPQHLATLELAETALTKAKTCAPREKSSDEAFARARERAQTAVQAAAEQEHRQLVEHDRQVQVDAGAALQLRAQLAQLSVELSHLGDLSHAFSAQHAARSLTLDTHPHEAFDLTKLGNLTTQQTKP